MTTIVGTRVNRFVILEHLGSVESIHYYRCKCDCGHEFRLRRQYLLPSAKGKMQQSCGCRSAERIAKDSALRTRHGLHKSSIYTRWQKMRFRCQRPTDISYKYYGAKGVKVCQRWETFENFFEDMGHPPFPGASIDRIDVTGNYEPANCRWATHREQENNRRNNLWITFQGKTQTAAQWAREVGIAPERIVQRIRRGRWTPERALTTPAKAHYSGSASKPDPVA